MLEARYRVARLDVDGTHLYQVDGQDTHWPGVTTPLGRHLPKDWLAPWAAKLTAEAYSDLIRRDVDEFGLPNIILDDLPRLEKEAKQAHRLRKESAANLGTRAHQAVDDIILGKKPTVTDDIKPCVDAFCSWWDESRAEILLGDTPVASRQFEYGGTLGAAIQTPAGLGILDLKTSNQIDIAHVLQLGAYWQAFREMYDITPDFLMILRLGKEKPEFEVKQVARPDMAFHGFKLVLDVYKFLQTEKFGLEAKKVWKKAA